jgi:hypothetical protein
MMTMAGQIGSTGMNLQSTLGEKDLRDRILAEHHKPVIEDGHLPVSKGKDHVGETMLQEYQTLRDEFILTQQAKKCIGALNIPVDINAGGKIIPTTAMAINIDDDPSTRDEVLIKADTVESFGNGGKSFDHYTITFQEEGQFLSKTIHSAGHTEDAMGDIGMGGGSSVTYRLDKSTGDVEYELPWGGKETIHNSLAKAPAVESPGKRSDAGQDEGTHASEILEERNMVVIDGVSLPRNSDSSQYFLSPGTLPLRKR